LSRGGGRRKKIPWGYGFWGDVEIPHEYSKHTRCINTSMKNFKKKEEKRGRGTEIVSETKRDPSGNWGLDTSRRACVPAKKEHDSDVENPTYSQ
jgi:hypothetical protein